jgi:hypothetical protein
LATIKTTQIKNMFNKSKKVKKILNSKLSNLEKIRNIQQGNTWKASLNDIFDLYLGSESSITKRLKNIYLTRVVSKSIPGAIGAYKSNVYDESLKENFRDLIQSAIEYIESNGIYKNKKENNFLSTFKNIEVISGCVTAIIIIYGIGNYFGNLEKEREIIKFESTLEKKNKEIENYKSKTTLLHKRIEELKIVKSKNEKKD